MKGILELNVQEKYAHLLFSIDEGKRMDDIRKVYLSLDDPRCLQLPIINQKIRKRYDESFYYWWYTHYKYSKEELLAAKLFKISGVHCFEPAGEECGTVYDESVACSICGAHRAQLNDLHLKRSTIPKKDMAVTIADEVVVSERFVAAVEKWGIKGCVFSPVRSKRGVIPSYYQLTSDCFVDVSSKTQVGLEPFDFSEREGDKVYKCPKGDTLGLNLLSEVHVCDSPVLREYDYLWSRQCVGVKRGLLRPTPFWLVSPRFRQMVLEEKLSGMKFNVAYIDEEK